jgi:gliding motility-associated-like protein
MNRFYTIYASVLILLVAGSFKIKAQNDCSCWQQRDTSYHYAPFALCTSGCGNLVPPYYRSDDASTSAFDLPFHFCFWGTDVDSVFINTNGDVTFNNPYTSFTARGFPYAGEDMIAPFWGDVDLRGGVGGSDVVLYKITPHYMIIQWDSVGYYEAHKAHTNSFQLIISDGTDPIIPKGNNVEFCYRQMQWTTGDANSDTGGFGGNPATVGANQGDGVRFVQIGLFDNGTGNYIGQYPTWPYDGVAWLNNKSFIFNLCAGSVAPLTSGVSPCDTFKVCLGDSTFIPFYFFTPVQGDSVWSNLAPPPVPGVSIVSNTPGPTDSLTVRIIGNNLNLGYNIINVYAFDNASPPDTTFTSFVVEVDTAPHIHLSVLRDTICIGDSAYLMASGGKIYSWSTGATTSTIYVSPTSTQTYSIGVSDGGCFRDSTLQVIVLPIPSPTITAKPDTICPRDSVLLTANGGGYYKWSSGQTKDSIWVNPDSTKTYKLYASNGYCSDSTQISVFVRTKGSTTLTHSTDTLCPLASFTVTASGGISYLWSNGATTNQIIVNPDSTTTYTVHDSVTCAVDSLKQKVVIIPLPKPLITGTNWKCKGVKDTLSVSGGTKYIWDNGTTKTSYYTGDINSDSTIKVYAFNSLGCEDSTDFTIVVRTQPTVTVSASTISCSGYPVLLTATATGTNSPFAYKWSTGQTTDTMTVWPDSSTVYTITASNGCLSTPARTTVTPDMPLLSACCDKVILSGDDTTIVAGGDSIKSYSWSPTVICLNPPLCDSVKVTPTVTTTYTVLGTDAVGCQTERVVTITVETPCFSFTVPNVFTPNHAGPPPYVDNVFYIKTQNISDWSIQIFDRWGKEVYKSTNPNQFWLGTTESGGEAPDGVYYYIISGSCQNNTYKKDGFVQLIR